VSEQGGQGGARVAGAGAGAGAGAASLWAKVLAPKPARGARGADARPTPHPSSVGATRGALFSPGGALCVTLFVCRDVTLFVRRDVKAPRYLSDKEQRAYLATAREAPLCREHREPAIQRTVLKPGPNIGRKFWVCPRPNGAVGDPTARCNFFQWVI
jgi:hypothetical protein